MPLQDQNIINNKSVISLFFLLKMETVDIMMVNKMDNKVFR